MEYWNGGMLQRAYLIKIIQHIVQLGCLDSADWWNGNLRLLIHIPTLASMFYIAAIYTMSLSIEHWPSRHFVTQCTLGACYSSCHACQKGISKLPVTALLTSLIEPESSKSAFSLSGSHQELNAGHTCTCHYIIGAWHMASLGLMSTTYRNWSIELKNHCIKIRVYKFSNNKTLVQLSSESSSKLTNSTSEKVLYSNP